MINNLLAQPADDAPASSSIISRISHVSLRSRPARTSTPRQRNRSSREHTCLADNHRGYQTPAEPTLDPSGMTWFSKPPMWFSRTRHLLPGSDSSRSTSSALPSSLSASRRSAAPASDAILLDMLAFAAASSGGGEGARATRLGVRVKEAIATTASRTHQHGQLLA